MLGTSQVDPDIDFSKSSLEFEFAHLWASLFPDLDLYHQWPLQEKAKRGKPKTLDFMHLPSRTGIELNGGIHARMGHSTGKGIQRDYNKAQICAARGIRLIPLSSADAVNEEKLQAIAAIMRGQANGQ